MAQDGVFDDIPQIKEFQVLELPGDGNSYLFSGEIEGADVAYRSLVLVFEEEFADHYGGDAIQQHVITTDKDGTFSFEYQFTAENFLMGFSTCTLLSGDGIVIADMATFELPVDLSSVDESFYMAWSEHFSNLGVEPELYFATMHYRGYATGEGEPSDDDDKKIDTKKKLMDKLAEIATGNGTNAEKTTKIKKEVIPNIVPFDKKKKTGVTFNPYPKPVEGTLGVWYGGPGDFPVLKPNGDPKTDEDGNVIKVQKNPILIITANGIFRGFEQDNVKPHPTKKNKLVVIANGLIDMNPPPKKEDETKEGDDKTTSQPTTTSETTNGKDR